ncbi:hypothetical protein GCM10025881_07720 [Pseudolysinimonas kribbensis]|uniref:Small ribosomal subunit protein uS2 n=2 Tax=Pseudolysinimonas kribbensis TaxID=433641 RepID=A0ABQ6K317_9MICO|nr:hypothetical protein GCM10025881_07720 [Pseudolysinimonas kribbensis]
MPCTPPRRGDFACHSATASIRSFPQYSEQADARPAPGIATTVADRHNREDAGRCASGAGRRRRTAMAVVTIRQLLDSGVHFGHQTRRWNPKVKRFILTERSGIHIIDLQQSLAYIDKAYDFVKETVAHGGSVLFVGTKKQAQETVAEQAQRVGQPYVNQRWLGGLLTNFQTVSKRLARMKELEEIDFDDTTKGFTKKELLIKKRELDKLHKTLGGIRNLTKTPSAIWVIDSKREHLAVDEATKLGIPIIGILDTNADPDELQYPIPGNDDAIRSVALLTRIIADAAAEGLVQRHQAPAAEGNVSAVEPLAEWEAELLHASENPQSEAERIEAVDQGPDAEAKIAEIVAAEVPVEENDADADLALTAPVEDASLVVEHAPESEEAAEARLEAEATEAEKQTPAQKKAAAKASAEADAESAESADAEPTAAAEK